MKMYFRKKLQPFFNSKQKLVFNDEKNRFGSLRNCISDSDELVMASSVVFVDVYIYPYDLEISFHYFSL